MTIAGSLLYETKLDTTKFTKGLNGIQKASDSTANIIKGVFAAMQLDKIVSAMMDNVRDSITSATSRMDTMDQYNRVMTTMTGSADKASESLEKIKTTVKGTAYGLDVAASATQNFVTSGLKIDKATEQVEVWGDAVSFYGKGTNEAFSSVTDALAKMSTASKVHTDDINKLTDQGIPVWQMYAEATGQSVDEVRSAVEAGEISGEKFMDVMAKALKNGTKTFGSVSGAAKEAGASWAGTIDNMKAAFARGMESILDSIDSGLSAMGLPTIKEMITNIGKTAEETMNGVGNLIKQILTPIEGKTIFESILTNMESVFTELFQKLSQKMSEILPKIIEYIPKIIEGITTGLHSIIKGITQVLNDNQSQIIETISTIIEGISTFLVENLPTIIETLINLLITVVEGITRSLPTIIPQLVNGIIDCLMSILDHIDEIIDVGIELLMGLADGLMEAMPQLIERIPEIIEKLVNAIAENLPKLINAGMKLIIKMGEGFLKGTPQILSKIPQIISSIRQAFSNYFSSMVDVGKNLLKGLGEGFTKAKDWVINKIKKICGDIKDSFLKFFKIGSPSKLFRDDVGQWVPKGIAVGIEANTDSIMKAIDGLDDEMVARLNNAVAFETGKINADASVKSNYAFNNTIVVQGTINTDVDLDGRKVGQSAAPYVMKAVKNGGIS